MAKALDNSAFLRGLDRANAHVQRGLRRGMGKLLAHGEKLMKKNVPIETGTLAGTCVGDLDSIQVSPSEVSGKLTAGGGEAADYAVRQHEEELHHTFPEEGVYASKYVEKAIEELVPKAAGVLAGEVRKELSGSV